MQNKFLKMQKRPITSLKGFIDSLTRRQVLEKKINGHYRVFFRGQSNKTWPWQPFIFREESLIRNEYRIYNEIYSNYISEFRNDKTTFDKLVRMAHYGLPTRLLDITTNPLVALYFAACKDFNTDGRVSIIYAPESGIKYSDSDTVACVSNLCRIKDNLKLNIHENIYEFDFNNSPPIRELFSKILEEKPHFQNKINFEDLNKIYCVIPNMNNSRILSQSGAFLLFGGISSMGNNRNGIENDELVISKNSKLKIMSELEGINMNQARLFPDIEKMANYVYAKYK